MCKDTKCLCGHPQTDVNFMGYNALNLKTLYRGVSCPINSYGGPSCVPYFSQSHKKKLIATQSSILIRVTKASATTSTEAVPVLAEVLHTDILHWTPKLILCWWNRALDTGRQGSSVNHNVLPKGRPFTANSTYSTLPSSQPSISYLYTVHLSWCCLSSHIFFCHEPSSRLQFLLEHPSAGSSFVLKIIVICMMEQLIDFNYLYSIIHKIQNVPLIIYKISRHLW